MTKFSTERKECWTCGKAGHFRTEYPHKKKKLSIVDLGGVKSTYRISTPRINKNANKVVTDFTDFSYFGKVEGRHCLFRIDTGSDVSILSFRLAKGIQKTRVKENLRHPTREKILIRFQVLVNVQSENILKRF